MQDTYGKQFDFVTGSFIYVNRFSRERYTNAKPPSLFDCDVPLPANEWQQVREPISAAEQFFNPFRGVFSRLNEEKVRSSIELGGFDGNWLSLMEIGFGVGSELCSELVSQEDVDRHQRLGAPAARPSAALPSADRSHASSADDSDWRRSSHEARRIPSPRHGARGTKP